MNSNVPPPLQLTLDRKPSKLSTDSEFTSGFCTSAIDLEIQVKPSTPQIITCTIIVHCTIVLHDYTYSCCMYKFGKVNVLLHVYINVVNVIVVVVWVVLYAILVLVIVFFQKSTQIYHSIQLFGMTYWKLYTDTLKSVFILSSHFNTYFLFRKISFCYLITEAFVNLRKETFEIHNLSI